MNLTFLHCAHFPRCRVQVDKRFEYHTVQLATEGRVKLQYGSRPHIIDGAGAWPAYPGPRIRFGPAEAGRWWEHRYAAFTGPRVQRWKADRLLLRGPQHLTPDAARGLAPMLDRVVAAVARGQRLDLIRAAHTLESLLIALAELRESAAAVDATEQARPAWMDTVLATLDDVTQPDPDYDALAATQQMAGSTLRRRFREIAGVSPHSYRLSRKMAEARRRLADTDQPVGEIANRLGYRDVYYFSRQFRQLAGVTPTHYRQSRQADPG